MEVKVSIRFIGICLQQCVFLLYCMQEGVKVMDGVRADIWGTFSTLLVLPLVEMGSYCWKTHTQWDGTHTLKGRIERESATRMLKNYSRYLCLYCSDCTWWKFTSWQESRSSSGEGVLSADWQKLWSFLCGFVLQSRQILLGIKYSSSGAVPVIITLLWK